ncbi:TetR/AcrR family transcriptional regulator [Paenibacillus soyae]|uniref:TetR/AcrR family transcriptional regulator n=1 Tax=Paenibacillus soyae TaxID=2969249 RepID=A0A9X2MT17_9BACL|nr:TetR/AcrR family transcriptional regulator [Paenibacillus soyae]MCR2806411.1 TetR/AcrR family transcriptional regulator [Paenibacillus soyae]
MTAVIDLVAEHGYNGVSTKEIAASAGVNEVTLFRHFGNKLNLLEKAFHHFHYAEEMQKLFEEKLTGDLHEDLLVISRRYHELMNRNRKLMEIALKEKQVIRQFQVSTHMHPQKLRDLLIRYFQDMQAAGKLADCNPEAQALAFMWMNHGAFVSRLNEDRMSFSFISLETFIEESVRTFAKALTP